MALRLGKAFNSSPELWLNMQRNYDLWKACSKIKVKHIRSLRGNEQPVWRTSQNKTIKSYLY
jgi:plasmid maintenance system antidote protein VapI